ncbi:hypothetical protein IAQ61_001373 [Plenodomus lingam]|uniref:uncharacterized protein n=1 Tax=Leptosphaeria maculans TaxID=5022 RepID=UPI00331D1191|nr:hypothetical protein IAQ61_001373 [Plenodomus lingam]
MTSASMSNLPDSQTIPMTQFGSSNSPRHLPPRSEEPSAWHRLVRNNLFRAITVMICFILMVVGSYFGASFIANVLRSNIYHVPPGLASTKNPNPRSTMAEKPTAKIPKTEFVDVSGFSMTSVASLQSTSHTVTTTEVHLLSSATPSLIECLVDEEGVPQC